MSTNARGTGAPRKVRKPKPLGAASDILYCTRCETWKSPDSFSNSKRFKNGKNTICKTCCAKIKSDTYISYNNYW